MRPIVWTNRMAGIAAGLVLGWLASIELGTSRTASRDAAEVDTTTETVIDTSTSRLFDAAAAVALSTGVASSRMVPRAAFKSQRTIFCGGIGLLLGSGVLSTIARRHLGRFHRDSLTVHADHTLIDTGPYHYVRHPLYTATIGVLCGIGGVLGNRISLGAMALPTAAILHRIAVEERMLVDALGESYVDYQMRTHKLLPHVW